MTDLGTYVEVNGRPAVRFVRTYPHPIERVWEAVTTSEGLAHWFPADVEIDLRPGGPSPTGETPTPMTGQAGFWPATRRPTWP